MPLQHLDEGMPLRPKEDAGDDGVARILVRADQAVVPALEEGRALRMAVVDLGMEGFVDPALHLQFLPT